jgi:hypothetical protein
VSWKPQGALIAAAVSSQQEQQQQQQQQPAGCYVQLYETNGEAHGCIPPQQLSPHFDGT